MPERIETVQVGAPDPERHNSPIIDESASDDQDGVEVESVEFARCHFNDSPYDSGTQVCSGDELLQCERGRWLRVGSCDRDNP